MKIAIYARVNASNGGSLESSLSTAAVAECLRAT
jgi:hypothetical protein